MWCVLYLQSLVVIIIKIALIRKNSSEWLQSDIPRVSVLSVCLLWSPPGSHQRSRDRKAPSER